jgi:Flp pilus assembly pilin Flp
VAESLISALSRCRVGARRAQNTVEYGLIIGTIVIVVLLGITAFGQRIEPWFASLAGRIITVGP